MKKTLVLLLLMGFRSGWGLSSSGIGPAGEGPEKSARWAAQADLLFERGDYAAARPLYEAVVWRGHQAAPRLLLRLAYAEQQARRPTAALRYLSMAHAREPRPATWRALVALAARQHLVGYPDTWQQELRVRTLRYYYPGLQALLALGVTAAVWLLVRRHRTGRAAWLGLAAGVAATGAYLHWLGPAPVALVARPGAAVMAGPGAGAAWLSSAAPGDRLAVLGHDDIWLRVQWQERAAYIRANDVLVVD